MAEPVTAAVASIATKEISKNLAEGFKDLKEFGKDGAREVKDAFESITNMIGVINPIIPGLKLLAAQITSGTAESSLTLMKGIMELVMSEEGKAAIAIIGDVISAIFKAIADNLPLVKEFLGVLADIWAIVKELVAWTTELGIKTEELLNTATDGRWEESQAELGIDFVDFGNPLGFLKNIIALGKKAASGDLNITNN